MTRASLEEILKMARGEPYTYGAMCFYEGWEADDIKNSFPTWKRKTEAMWAGFEQAVDPLKEVM